MSSIKPEDIRHGGKGNFLIEEKEEMLNFLFKIVREYSIPPLDSIYSKTIRSKFISNSDLEMIKKKYETMVLFINLPEMYLVHYYDTILSLKEASLSKGPTHEEIDKIVDLIEFFYKFGYLTKKQEKYSKFLKRSVTKAERAELNLHEKNKIIDKIIMNLKPEGIELAKERLEIAIANEEKTLKTERIILDRILSTVKTEKMNPDGEVKEDKNSVPQKMMSLKEMRQQLMFVG